MRPNNSVNLRWLSVASSSDGNRLVGAPNNYFIETFSTRTETGPPGSISAGQDNAIELIYLGNGVFDVISFAGTSFVVK